MIIRVWSIIANFVPHGLCCIAVWSWWFASASWFTNCRIRSRYNMFSVWLRYCLFSIWVNSFVMDLSEEMNSKNAAMILLDCIPMRRNFSLLRVHGEYVFKRRASPLSVFFISCPADLFCVFFSKAILPFSRRNIMNSGTQDGWSIFGQLRSSSFSNFKEKIMDGDTLSRGDELYCPIKRVISRDPTDT